MHDVIVVGGGPAGITAAVYLKRFKLDVVVLMKDFGTLAKTDHIENYYGFAKPITGPELVQNGIDQAKNMGIPVWMEEVLGIDSFDAFTVKTAKNQYPAKAVLLATGAARSTLKIKGFKEFEGKGISFCAVCDGFLYRGKTLGVVGSGEFMFEELEVLRQFAKDVIVFTNGNPLEVDVHGARVVPDPLVRIEGDDSVKSVSTANQTVPIDALFVAAGTPSASDFALRMGAFLNKNDIAVDQNYMTNIPGLFAAGDCIGGFYQIAKAVSDGAHASVAINKYLRNLKA